MGYTKNVITGFGWQVGLKIGNNLVTLAKVAILARLISPAEFGLFSLTIVAIGLTEAFTDTGINVTIVQSDKSTRHFLDSAWVISIARGILIALIMLILGWLMGWHFAQRELRDLVWLAASIPIIRGFINPYLVNWYKELKFDRDTSFRFSLHLFESLLAVLLGWWLKSAWALVGAMLGSALFEVMLSFFVIKIRPKLKINADTAKQIITSAKHLTLTGGLQYLNENLDNLMIGQLSGTYNLGLYHNAYGLSHKPNYELAKGAFASLFPVFSRVKHDQERLWKGFKKSLLTMITLTFVVSLPLLFFPELVVKIVLGEKWLIIVPVVPWLTLAGWLQGIGHVVYSGWLATKKYFWLNSHLFLTLILMVSLINWLGGQYGLIGLGWALFFTRLLSLPMIIVGVLLFKRKTNEIKAN